jgi:hypothetical protein
MNTGTLSWPVLGVGSFLGEGLGVGEGAGVGEGPGIGGDGLFAVHAAGFSAHLPPVAPVPVFVSGDLAPPSGIGSGILGFTPVVSVGDLAPPSGIGTGVLGFAPVVSVGDFAPPPGIGSGTLGFTPVVSIGDFAPPSGIGFGVLGPEPGVPGNPGGKPGIPPGGRVASLGCVFPGVENLDPERRVPGCKPGVRDWTCIRLLKVCRWIIAREALSRPRLLEWDERTE